GFLPPPYSDGITFHPDGVTPNRYPVITNLIHIESCKSPTAELFDVDSGRIFIVTVNTEKYHSDVLARSQG
ncbi:hypothetical protein Tco_0778102, partial [Tanacetum coccineum]